MTWKLCCLSFALTVEKFNLHSNLECGVQAAAAKFKDSTSYTFSLSGFKITVFDFIYFKCTQQKLNLEGAKRCFEFKVNFWISCNQNSCTHSLNFFSSETKSTASTRRNISTSLSRAEVVSTTKPSETISELTTLQDRCQEATLLC